MTPVYVVFIFLMIGRLLVLMRRKKMVVDNGRMTEPNKHLIRIFLCIVALAQPIAVLVLVNVNDAIPPALFEQIGNAVAVGAWLSAIVTLSYECFVFFRDRGLWVERFCFTWVWIGASVKFRSVILLAALPGRESYYTWIYIVWYLAVFLLFAMAHLHFPTTGDVSDEEVLRAARVARAQESQRRDKRKGVESTCPIENANPFSWILFSWMTPLVALGHRRVLLDDDVWQLPRKDRAIAVNAKFDVKWAAQLAQPTPSLFAALRQAFGAPMYWSVFPKLLNDASQFVGPVILQQLIKFTVDESAPAWHGYALAGGIFLGMIIGAIGENVAFFASTRVGLWVRTSLIHVIYEKALRMSNSARRSVGVGAITNYMSSDAEKISQALTQVHALWSSPLRVGVALALLSQQLGWAVVAGLLMIVIALPLQAKLVQKNVFYRKLTLGTTDRRLSLVNEVLNGIQVIKFYVWDRSFHDKIDVVREEELGYLRKSATFQAINFMLFTANPILVSLVSFAAFVIFGGTLTAEVAFTSLALFNVLRFPLIFFPRVLNSLVEARVSLNRISDYLLQPDQERRDYDAMRETLLARKKKRKSKEAAIVVEDGHFDWGGDESTFALRDINFRVNKGELVIVLGATASGKSSLLAALLGDMQRKQGKVAIGASVAYVAQQAWIFNASVKENIIFYGETDNERYERAVMVSQLETDLERLADGDATEIGEKGVNMSGGQKQRMNVARAVYADADLYLFDDPLSALDAHVAHALFDECIEGHLADKTRVLVTNQLQFLPRADRVLMMDGGEIIEQGTFRQLIEKDGRFADLMREQGLHDAEEAAREAKRLNKEHMEKMRDVKSNRSVYRERGDRTRAGELIVEEERATGSVAWSVYFKYLQAAATYPTLALFVLVLFATEGSRIGASFWLSFWSSQANSSAADSATTMALEGEGEMADSRVWYFLGIYSLLTLSSAIIQLINSLLIAFGSVRASRVLHSKLIKAVMRAPMAWFDTTPIGRIVNRFSKDIGRIDTELAFVVSIFISGVFSLLGTVVVIGINTPYALVVFVPVFALFWWLQSYFRSTARELKRLDAVTRSPIYANFSETLNGITTVRAYGAVERMIEQNVRAIDQNQRINFAIFSSNRWLSMRLELLGGTMILATAMFVVLQRTELSPDLVGLTLTYGLQITALFAQIVRLFTETEVAFNAVERINFYIETAPEAAMEVERVDAPLQRAWPSDGALEFKDIVMRYRPDLPPVLRGLSAKIGAREKIGVVGRTAAGKSTLFQMVFRMVELDEGEILVDGVDISKLGLALLRKRISIIPQTPTLFMGTVRYNLDPFDEHDDNELWRALKSAFLADAVTALPGKLDAVVEDGGSNFAVGQRQLLCLARALLRHSRIIFIDEASANVDVETDALLQKTIRADFKDCTVVTIAHRLVTIMDSDRVIVMDHGQIKEFDTPRRLLKKRKGMFSALVAETGDEMEAMLIALANGREKVDFDRHLKLEQTMAEMRDAESESESEPAWRSAAKPKLQQASNLLEQIDTNGDKKNMKQKLRQVIDDLQNVVDNDLQSSSQESN